jgi:hypothetical protein
MEVPPPPSPSSLFSEDLDTSFNQALRHLSIDAVDSLSSQQDLPTRTKLIRTEVQKRILAMADPESPPPAARLPKFEMAREYDGKSSAAHWLTKLGYDFEQSGQVPPPPSLYLKAIDMLFVGDAATWLDSTPQMRYIVDNKAAATVIDVREFEDALKEQFPAAQSKLFKTCKDGRCRCQIRSTRTISTMGSPQDVDSLLIVCCKGFGSFLCQCIHLRLRADLWDSCKGVKSLHEISYFMAE